MKIQQIRYQKLRLLLTECAGNQAELARKAETNPAYISQILNRTPLPSGRPRSVGERLARKLEYAFDKPDGWMDSEYLPGVTEKPAEYRCPSPQMQRLITLAEQLTPTQLQAAISMLAELVKKKSTT